MIYQYIIKFINNTFLHTHTLFAHPQLMIWIVPYIQALMQLALAHTRYLQQQERKALKTKKRVWMRPYLQRRMDHDHYENVMQKLTKECPYLYRNFTQLDKSLFEEIVKRVTAIIQRKSAFWGQSIPPGVRVAITYVSWLQATPTRAYSMRFGWLTTSLTALCQTPARQSGMCTEKR